MGKPPATPDRRLALIARGQYGAFTLQQALEAGFSPAAVKGRLRSGRWLALHRGVYSDVASAPSPGRDVAAAVLACGPGAAASHNTAGRWWDLDVPAADRPEVSVPFPNRCRPPGVSVHRTSRLTRSEAAPRNGVRVTAPGRTLLDLAATLDPHLLELSHDRLWRRGLVDPARLLTYLQDDWCRRRRGSGILRELVAERVGQGPSGSDLETRLMQLIRRSGLPLPVRQYPVMTPFGPRYLDLAYPAPKIAIELDGMESRLDPEVFLDERVRQNLIQGQGWTFRRFGYTHVSNQPLWTIFSLGEALGLHPVRWR